MRRAMGFLAEMLAVAVVWLSTFALCQFGLVLDHVRPSKAESTQARTVNRTREAAMRPAPVDVKRPAAAHSDT
ncbi:hypothetical protein OVA11_10615 [Caulobacter sp. SL161]|uniref:hypothetical protein n=1 Tax=Caulobacter sp. SL161 TaxID=2995156 RepID=UPI0022730140|nr:hypothetical protein [Caulobacter sp. SL161]MCY1647491.1 hypothetical protein [Caulobacter sp. SL161]